MQIFTQVDYTLLSVLCSDIADRMVSGNTKYNLKFDRKYFKDSFIYLFVYDMVRNGYKLKMAGKPTKKYYKFELDISY